MIHEAVDAAFSLAQALAVLLLVCAVFATAALYTLVVAVTVACMAVSRGVAAGLAAVRWGGVDPAEPGPQKSTDVHTGPSWARTDKEAA